MANQILKMLGQNPMAMGQLQQDMNARAGLLGRSLSKASYSKVQDFR